MPQPALIYEQLNNLKSPYPCAHVVDNCLWKEQAQPILDMANEELAQVERFY
jgi:hypothetical protein